MAGTYKAKYSEWDSHEAIYIICVSKAVRSRGVDMPTDYKNPLPASQACSTIHGLMHGRHHEACKHTSRLSYRSKDGYAFRNL